jgi:hypothetical protein
MRAQTHGVEIPVSPRDGEPGTFGNTEKDEVPRTDRRGHIAGCRVKRISIMESIATPSGSRYVERYGTDL